MQNPDPDAGPRVVPGDRPNRVTSVVMAACWGLSIAAGTALATWSGKYYIPIPLWPVTIAAAGAAAVIVGLTLERIRIFRTVGLRAAIVTLLVFAVLGLATLGYPADTGFGPDTWAGIRDLRGSCLAGTEFTDPTAVLSISADTVTVTGSSDGELRFTTTDETWPSSARAEIWGHAAIPGDLATRTALAAAGCR
ncbi:hypothetical protein ACIQUM_33330 [Amycolatopsis azurea]|uniref:hypothetical protein n=1 Tax=Amycolatopsis azurea TaxID=36819 RepID=UPI003821EB17